MTSDNEKLIKEAREVVHSWDLKGSWNTDSPIGMLARMADALEAAEKAHTPTGHAKESDTSRERVKNGADSSHVTPTDDERERKHAEMCGCDLPRCEFIQGWESAWDAAYRSILRRAEPQGDPSDVTLDEIEQRVYDEHRGQIAGMAKALVRAGWDAALRAASAATEQGENR